MIFLFIQIPIVENELKKESGEVKPEEEVTAAPAPKLVTEMGTYVTQSALSTSRPSKKEEDRWLSPLADILWRLSSVLLLKYLLIL